MKLLRNSMAYGVKHEGQSYYRPFESCVLGKPTRQSINKKEVKGQLKYLH